MIQAITFDRGSGVMETGSFDLINNWKDQQDSIIWIDLINASDSEDKFISEFFAFNSLEMADATRLRHPPKIEFFDDHFLMILRVINSINIEVELDYFQLAIFVSERYIITRRIQNIECVDAIWTSLKNNKISFSYGTSHILYQISRKVADQYFNILEELEDRLEVLESLLTTDLTDRHLAELSKYNGALRKINRVMTYHKNIFNSLLHTDTNSYIKNNLHEYNDIYEHMERSASLSLMHQKLSSDLANSYLSITSHRVNKIVKTLTVFTVLFVPLSFIAGLYGMNFEYMPELKFKYGYFFVLGVMVVVFGSLLYFLRKMK